MTPEDALAILLAVSLALSGVLALLSTAMMGRTVADMERQAERGIVGAPRLQAWVNLRAHIGRTLLGLIFIFITVLLLAGAPEFWRTWSFRILFVVLLGYYTVASVLDWAAEAEQVRLGLREVAADRAHREALAAEALGRRADDVANDRASYIQIADEAVANLELATNREREASGLPPLVVVAAVVPEHNSPASQAQAMQAATATLRARLVAATLALNLPPREAPSQNGSDAPVRTGQETQ